MLLSRFELAEYRIGAIPALLWQRVGEEDGALILVLHGLGDWKLGSYPVWLSFSLAQAGFRALALDARSHGARADFRLWEEAGSGEGFMECIESTAQDLSRLLDHFQAEAAGVVGFSLGGYVAYRAAAQEPRLKALASIGASPDFSDSLSAVPGMGLSLNQELLRRMESLNPITGLSSGPKIAILILAGEADEYLSAPGLARTRQALAQAGHRVKLVRYPGVGHEITPEMISEVIRFFRQHL